MVLPHTGYTSRKSGGLTLYPLLNVYITMERSSHFEWVNQLNQLNQLCKWPCSIAMYPRCFMYGIVTYICPKNGLIFVGQHSSTVVLASSGSQFVMGNVADVVVAATGLGGSDRSWSPCKSIWKNALGEASERFSNRSRPWGQDMGSWLPLMSFGGCLNWTSDVH